MNFSKVMFNKLPKLQMQKDYCKVVKVKINLSNVFKQTRSKVEFAKKDISSQQIAKSPERHLDRKCPKIHCQKKLKAQSMKQTLRLSILKT